MNWRTFCWHPRQNGAHWSAPLSLMTTQYRKPLSDWAMVPVAKAYCRSHTLSCTSENNFAGRLKSPSPLSAARQTTPVDPNPAAAGGPDHAPKAQFLKPRIPCITHTSAGPLSFCTAMMSPKSTLHITLINASTRVVLFLGVQLRSNIV